MLLEVETNVDKLPLKKMTDALTAGTVSESIAPWFQAALALHAYRNGDPLAAAELADRGYEQATANPDPIKPPLAALLKAVSSLAHSALGRTDEAASDLSTAKQLLASRIEYHPDGSVVGDSLLNESDMLFHDVLIAELLVRQEKAALR